MDNFPTTRLLGESTNEGRGTFRRRTRNQRRMCFPFEVRTKLIETREKLEENQVALIGARPGFSNRFMEQSEMFEQTQIIRNERKYEGKEKK